MPNKEAWGERQPDRLSGQEKEFAEDLENSLCGAIAINTSNVKLQEKNNMPSPTFVAASMDGNVVNL